MKKYGIKSYDELLRKSTKDIEWWNAVNEDLGLTCFKKYDSITDYKNKDIINNVVVLN